MPKREINVQKSRKINRREFLRLAGAAAAGAALAGCSSPTPAPQAGGEPVKLVYQDWRTDWFPALAQEMLAQFHEQQPGIRVFYTADPENLEEAMLAHFEAGTAPDVFSGCCAFFPAWAQKGHLLDLRPYVEADLDQADIDDWSEAQYRAFFTPDGKQFALPKYHGGLALYYNKDIFDEAGVPYPAENWTYDDYLIAMRELTVRSEGKTTRWGSMVDISWDRLQIHANGWGGHFVNPQDPTRCDMSTPASMGAFEWLYACMWEDKVMATSLDVENMETRAAFINQKIAMVEDGSWALKDILAQAEFRVGVAPFPTGPVRHATLATTDGFAIAAKTRNPDAAWELLKFLAGKEYGRAMARYHFLQPARASIIPDWVDYIRKEFPDKSKDVDITAFADGHIKGYSVTAEVFPNMLEVIALARETWDNIYTVGKTPVSDIEILCEKIEALQKQSSGAPASCGCGGTSG
jgi:multiple sugar transport system substrate-binding protein